MAEIPTNEELIRAKLKKGGMDTSAIDALIKEETYSQTLWTKELLRKGEPLPLIAAIQAKSEELHNGQP